MILVLSISLLAALAAYGRSHKILRQLYFPDETLTASRRRKWPRRRAEARVYWLICCALIGFVASEGTIQLLRVLAGSTIEKVAEQIFIVLLLLTTWIALWRTRQSLQIDENEKRINSLCASVDGYVE